MVEIIFKEKVFGSRVKSHLRRNMIDAVQKLEGVIKTKLSVGQPTKWVGKGKHRKLRGLDPSISPNPPKVVTGALKESIRHTVTTRQSEIIGRVGSFGAGSVPYARRLEMGFFGVDGVQARPYLRSSLAESRAKITAILGRP